MTCLCFTSLRHCTRALLQVHRCPLNAGKGMRPVRNGAEMRGYVADRRRKKALNVSSGLLYLFDAWQFPTLAWGDPTLPSALRRFTSEFGMGSGGTTALLPPGKFCFIRPLLRSDLICIRLKIFSHPPKHLRRCKVKPHGSLVPVSSTHRCAYTPGLSTSSSSTSLQEP